MAPLSLLDNAPDAVDHGLPMTMKHALLFIAAAALAFLQPGRPAARADDKPAGGNNKIRVACVGDSITFGAGIKDREHNAYPAQLQRMLGDHYDVRNFGVSGRTLLKHGDYPYWKEQAFKDAKDFAPNIVIIKLGTNDTKPQNWRYKDEFAPDAKAMVETFQGLSSKPTLYLCHPVPAFPGNFGIRDQIIKDEVNPAIDQVAKETGAQVIDLYTALKDHKDLFPDKVHPNAQGATIIAETIAKVLMTKEAVKH
jgi:lysophospholipase L1-like esterase